MIAASNPCVFQIKVLHRPSGAAPGHQSATVLRPDLQDTHPLPRPDAFMVGEGRKVPPHTLRSTRATRATGRSHQKLDCENIHCAWPFWRAWARVYPEALANNLSRAGCNQIRMLLQGLVWRPSEDHWLSPEMSWKRVASTELRKLDRIPKLALFYALNQVPSYLTENSSLKHESKNM